MNTAAPSPASTSATSHPGGSSVPQVPALEGEYVGFWPRAGAACIDVLACGVLVGVLSDFFSPRVHGVRPQDLMSFTLDYLVPAVAVLAFWFTRGATPGKMVIRAVIVDESSLQAATRVQLLVRYVSYFLSGFALFLGFLWVAFDPRKQGWHDKIARTVVVRAPAARDRGQA